MVGPDAGGGYVVAANLFVSHISLDGSERAAALKEGSEIYLY